MDVKKIAQKFKKMLQISTPRMGIEGDYKTLAHAVNVATERAIQFNQEAVVMLSTFDMDGEVIGSVVVARIRAKKFDEFGGIKE